MPEFAIRHAVEADLAAVQDCLVETWHATYDPIFGVAEVTETSGRWHAIEVLRAQLTEPDSAFLVAEAAMAIIGTALARQTAPSHVKLGRLYVRPRHQGRGIGKALLAAAIAQFTEVTRIELEVEPRNMAAIKFYEARGFALKSTQDSCGGDPAHSSVVYEKRMLPR